MSTQVPLQSVNPVWQLSAHLPEEQTCPDLQAVPQAPQLARSDWVLTQVPEQSVRLDWQDSAHLPSEQTSPALQLVPQAPQFPFSALRLAQ